MAFVNFFFQARCHIDAFLGLYISVYNCLYYLAYILSACLRLNVGTANDSVSAWYNVILSELFLSSFVNMGEYFLRPCMLFQSKDEILIAV